MAQADPRIASKVQLPQGADTLIIASGGKLILDAGATLDLSDSAALGIGILPLNLFGARAVAANDIPNTAATPPGGLLTLNSAPTLKRLNAATDKGIKVEWAAASVIEIVLPPVVYPPDLDDTKNVVLKLAAKMAGATDTPTITANFFEGIGDADAGGATAALSNALQILSVTIAAANVGAYPNFASVSLTPGAHGTDALALYAAWLEYSKKTTA